MFKKASANGSFWQHLIVERYIHQRVTLYPGKVRAISIKGQPCRVEYDPPIQMHRDEYWQQLAKSKVPA